MLIKRVSCILIILFSILVSSYAYEDGMQSKIKKTAVGLNGKLSVSGNHLVNEYGKSVVLSGISLGWHNWWSDFYNKDCVNTLVDEWGCSLVRAAMGVDANSKNTYFENQKFAVKCVTDVADAAIDKGIYVIIDWHCHHLLQSEACSFFETMAKKYKGVPNVIYEIFNEPWADDYSWEEVKQYSIKVIDTIRAIDKDALIIVGSPRWDTALKEVSESPIVGYSNIIYSLHFYVGAHKQSIRDVADAALKKGIPIFVSECGGMNADGKGPVYIDEWEKWQNWMRLNKISWCAWSLTKNPNETCSMLKDPKSSFSGPWKDSQLSSWGNLVYSTLKDKALK